MKGVHCMLRSILSIFFVLAIAPTYAADFRLTSPAIQEQGKMTDEQVFSGMGCSGKNVSPELHWDNAPKDTKSFGVTVYDPDAPTGSGWWHWVMFNIPSTVHTLPANAGKPDGNAAIKGAIQSRNDFGRPGYGGPCPPAGDRSHRYVFTVYALKVDQLPLKKDASGAMVGFYLNQNALAKASLTALYGR
jgi:Raf kinase inhibitor-like YbhB/YbcL family protein